MNTTQADRVGFQYGLEKEFFILNVLDEGEEGLIEPQVCPTFLSADGCGFLAEARGEPQRDPVDAVFSLSASEFRLRTQAKLAGYELTDSPLMKVSKKVRTEAGRIYSKGLTAYQNFYGYHNHRNGYLEHTAGVHVSVTCGRYVNYFSKKGESKAVYYYANFDWPRLFLALDKEFKAEIKAAKRLPGFYELKPEGRVEYRSLPSNVDLHHLASFLQAFRW